MYICGIASCGWVVFEKPGEVIDWTLTCASTLVQPCDRLVGRGRLEFRDGLGALGDSVFAELAREHEPDRSLDLAGRERFLLGVAAELGGLESDALEDIINKRVHDRHALLGDARVRVDLLEDAVDVGRIALRFLSGFFGLSGFLRRLGGLRDTVGSREVTPVESRQSVTRRSPRGRFWSVVDVRKRLRRVRHPFHQSVHIKQRCSAKPA